MLDQGILKHNLCCQELSDFLELLSSIQREKEFKNTQILSEKLTCISTILASDGYPEKYLTGFPVSGLNTLSKDTIVFHAGTKKDDKTIETNGGRVLAISSFGKKLKEAKQKNLGELKKVSFKGMVYRSDIGFDLK